MRTIEVVGAFALALLAAGCASASTQPGQDADAVTVSDPFENVNRFFFDINQRFDRHAGKPAATVYKDAIPQTVRGSLHNLLDNLGAPVTAANDLLQVRFSDAGVAV